MTHPLAWLPPFVVGAAAVVAGEVAGGLLLYSGEGFLRALTLVLATVFGAFALGLWSAPGPGLDRPVETLRRRWLLVLMVFASATATAAAWSVLGGLASGAVTRGIGLALLAAAPLYGAGALLGTMGAVRTDLGARGPGAAAAAGGVAGALFTGVFFMRAAAPLSMYVLAIVALSAAALLHGRVLDRAFPESPEEGGGAPAEGGAVSGEGVPLPETGETVPEEGDAVSERTGEPGPLP